MESLNLLFPSPAQAAVLSEPELGDCAAGGAPRFFLVPAFRPATRHLIQSLAAHVVLLLAGLASAMLFAPLSAEKSSLNPTRRPDATTLVLYDPNPTRKSNVSGRWSAPRRLSPRQQIAKPVASPVDEPAWLVTVSALVPQSPSPGIPMSPVPAPSSVSVNLGLPMVPAAHVPSLDPAMTRVSSLPLEAENTGRDPLRSVEATGLLAKGNGDGRIGNGAPDLSARPTRSIEPQRVRAEHAAFTKPKISFMPKPEYPPAALRDRIEGDVSVKVTFGKNGNVIFRGLVRQLGNEELNSAARETVQQIRFAPATRDDDGVPVDQDAVITVTFRLTQMTLTASF